MLESYAKIGKVVQTKGEKGKHRESSGKKILESYAKKGKVVQNYGVFQRNVVIL